MTPKYIILVAPIALAVAGCASQWRPRPGATLVELAQDRYRCTQESRTGFSAGGTGYAGAGAIIGSAIAAQANAQYLLDLCLEARGHIKVERTAETGSSPLTVGTAQSSPVVASPVPAAAASPPNIPPGGIAPTMYYIPYPGSEPIPVQPPSGPASGNYPENQVGLPGGYQLPPLSPVKRKPAVGTNAPNMFAERKYQIGAEKLAKANGCIEPAPTLNTKAPGTEVYGITCASGHVIIVRCDYGDCRLLTGITP